MGHLEPSLKFTNKWKTNQSGKIKNGSADAHTKIENDQSTIESEIATHSSILPTARRYSERAELVDFCLATWHVQGRLSAPTRAFSTSVCEELLIVPLVASKRMSTETNDL